MVRDFTDATLEDIINCCKIADGEMEDIEADFNDPNGLFNAMNEYMGGEDILGTERENLLNHYYDLITECSYTEASVRERFEEVRELDETYGNTLANHKSEALDNYITSMRELVDVISVGAPGTPAMTAEELRKARENYSKYGSVDMSYGSIFASYFQTKLDQVGDGVITPTFNNIYNDGVVDWEKVDKMMLEGATYWEIAALSKLLDTYMNDSGELGIDTNGYAEFLDHCYIPKSIITPEYALSDTVTELMLYRQNVTEKTLLMHGAGYGNSEINSEEDDKKVRYNCFISDSLMMICTYYDCIEVERERYGHMLSMNVNTGENEVDSITIDVPYAKESISEDHVEIKPITICLFNASIDSSFDKALKGVFSSAQKDEDKKVVNAGIKIMKDLLFGIVGDMAKDFAVGVGANESLYGGGEITVKFGIDLFGLSQVREETIEYNQQLDGLINAVDYQGILKALSTGGTVCQCGNDILINNRVVDESDLLMSICYYNAETGSDLKLEELEQQLRNYELSSGNTADLEAFCAYVKKEGAYMAEATDDYLNYCKKVSDVLNEQGLNSFTATRDQLEAACKEVLEK